MKTLIPFFEINLLKFEIIILSEYYYFIYIKILFEINSFEINLTLKILKPELENFYKNLEKFTPRLIKFLKCTGYKGHLIDMPHIIEKKFFF